MPENHIVRKGECLSSIAAIYGFPDYRTIYDHPTNAELRKLRPNPNLLCAGDEVQIPDRVPKTMAIKSGQTHTFAVTLPAVKLRLLIRDSAGKTAAGCKYRLKVGALDEEKTVPSNGIIEAVVPRTDKKGVLWVSWRNDAGYQAVPIELAIGYLDPAELPTGYQARLTNLGYRRGPFTGRPGRRTRAGLNAFQSDEGLTVTGLADQKTCDRLAKRHDSEV